MHRQSLVLAMMMCLGASDANAQGFFSMLFNLLSHGEAPAVSVASSVGRAASHASPTTITSPFRAAASEVSGVRGSFNKAAMGTSIRLSDHFALAASPSLVRRGGSLSGSTGTQIVERAVSYRELQGMLEKQLRTGTASLRRPVRGQGNIFVANSVPTNATRATRTLALPSPPAYVVRMEVSSKAFPAATRAQPKYGMPGGGLERMAPGTRVIPVRVQSYRPVTPPRIPPRIPPPAPRR